MVQCKPQRQRPGEANMAGHHQQLGKHQQGPASREAQALVLAVRSSPPDDVATNNLQNPSNNCGKDGVDCDCIHQKMAWSPPAVWQTSASVAEESFSGPSQALWMNTSAQRWGSWWLWGTLETRPSARLHHPWKQDGNGHHLKQQSKPCQPWDTPTLWSKYRWEEEDLGLCQANRLGTKHQLQRGGWWWWKRCAVKRRLEEVQRLCLLPNRDNGRGGKDWRGGSSVGGSSSKRSQVPSASLSELHMTRYHLQKTSRTGMGRIQPVPSVQLQRRLSTSWPGARPALRRDGTPGGTTRSSKVWQSL